MKSLLRAAIAVTLAVPIWQVTPVAHAAAPTAHVSIALYVFAPASLTITPGTTVTWMNHDEAKHDVATTDAPVPFKSPLLSRDQSWSFTFTVPGTYRYYCSVHPNMRGEIIVRAEPPPAVSTPAKPRNETSARASDTAATASPTSTAHAHAIPANDGAATGSGPNLGPLGVTAIVTMLAAILSLLVLSTRPSPAQQ